MTFSAKSASQLSADIANLAFKQGIIKNIKIAKSQIRYSFIPTKIIRNLKSKI
ncbi:MAG: hypothetical protein WBF90_15420 [Rivularia sp. (in: cyanobacteria)]